jgi:hypothetical protein
MADEQPTQEDRDWAAKYGASGNTPKGYQKQQHQGTEDEAKSRDNAIIDAAMSKADEGKRVPDNALRKQ